MQDHNTVTRHITSEHSHLQYHKRKIYGLEYMFSYIVCIVPFHPFYFPQNNTKPHMCNDGLVRHGRGQKARNCQLLKKQDLENRKQIE